MKSQQTNIVIYYLNLLILFLSLILLIWLRTKFAKEMASTISSIKSHFSMETVLKSPDDIQINFSRISEIVNNNKRNPFVKNLFVSKIITEKGEQLIHPFYFAAINPNWKDYVKQNGWIKEELSLNGNVYGFLYIALNNSPLRNVTIAALSIAVLLIISIILFMTRLRAQEIVISKTTIELQEKYKELIHLERLALAGRLTANIFHDIKKPIFNIKHEISDIEEQNEISEKYQEFIKNIKKQIDLFLSIIRDLNIERFVKSNVEDEQEYSNVNDLIDRSLNLVRYEQNYIQILKDYDNNIQPILINPYYLIQVFSNIILNAYEAMGENGKLEIKSHFSDNKINIIFKDSGPGVPEDIKDKLFEPFYSTKTTQEGSGLGLYISKSIINKIGGDIIVESGDGKGAIFKVIITKNNDED